MCCFSKSSSCSLNKLIFASVSYLYKNVFVNTIQTLHKSVGVGGSAQENPSFKMKYLPRFWLVLSLASHCLAGTTVTSMICSSLSLTGPRCETHKLKNVIES